MLVCFLCAGNSFLAIPSGTRYVSTALPDKLAGTSEEAKPFGDSQSYAMAAVGAGLLLGGAAAAAMKSTPRGGKTAARYTTAEIVPALSWVKAEDKDGVVKASDFGPGDKLTLCLAGCDICIGKTESGKLFAVGDKAPPTGTSISMGGDIEGETIRDGQWGCRFDVFTGDVVEWCPSPPGIGAFVGNIMGGPQKLYVFDVRQSFFGGDVEILVDLNAKKAYEADYWKGLLDAQGKDDGTYY